MSSVNVGNREIALGLTQAVRPLLTPGAPAVQRLAAREVAQLLGLAGLDAALAELDRFAAIAWPAEVKHLAARIARVTAQAESDAAVTAYFEADAELASHASHLAAQDWSRGMAADSPTLATLMLSDQLADLAIDKPALLERERVTLAVAASLRAALDWLGAGEAGAIEAHVHDTALTLTSAVAHPGGIAPAAAVLASVEGSVLPDGERWTIRVPLHAGRGSYLLIRQGHLSLALPWHAVARLRMCSEADRAAFEEPLLASFVPGISLAGERPAALVALGLQRAWCVVDRIVWRIAAEPEREDAGPFAAATESVRLDDGERFWLLPPAWCLRGIAPLVAPPPSPRPRASHAIGFASELPPSAPMLELLRSDAPEPIAEDTLAELRAEVDRALGRLETTSSTSPASPVFEPAPAPAMEDAPAPAAEPPLSAWDAIETLTFGDEDGLESDEVAPPAPLPLASAEPVEPAESSAPTEPVAPPVAGASHSPGSSRIFSAHLEVLRPESVRPLDHLPPRTPPAARPAAPPPPAPEPAARIEHAAPVAPPAAPAPALPMNEPLRALVVDDSLVARVFLTRLLERRGFVVDQAADAAECWSLLPEQRWTVLMVDFALPDASGREHIAGVVQFAQKAGGTTVIALTRDAAEERVALLAGAPHFIRKPFEAETVDALLRRIPVTSSTPEGPR